MGSVSYHEGCSGNHGSHYTQNLEISGGDGEPVSGGSGGRTHVYVTYSRTRESSSYYNYGYANPCSISVNNSVVASATPYSAHNTEATQVLCTGDDGIYHSNDYTITVSAGFSSSSPNLSGGVISGNATLSVPSYGNDINAGNPAQSSQNGLIFNLTTSDGGSGSNITNEPANFTKKVLTTATISNIRSNVTGAHYSGSNIGSGTADPISGTFNTADYVVNLYTAWDTYAVTYDANGGTTTPATQTKTYGQGLTLANAITRNSDHYAGYTVRFDPNGGSGSSITLSAGLTITYSFYKGLDDDDTEYDGGGTYTKNKATTMGAAGDRTYVRGSVTAPAAPSRADGTATRTVTFNANGGTCDIPSLNSTATVTYTGQGWYALDNLSYVRRVGNGETYTPTKDETLYQQWSSSTGTFTSITLPIPVRSGYTFLGGSEDPTASTGVTGSYTPASSVTLYALWHLNREQAVGRIKQNGTGKKGFLWYNDNGEGKKVKNAYIKQNGAGVKSPY